MAERPDDEQVTGWALAAGRGDRAALAAFVRATQRDVLRFVSHLADPGQAEDLAQETYLRAVGSLPRFEAAASARTWLLSIARRVAADAVRAAGRRPRTTAVGDWDAVALTERTGAVRRAGEEAVLLGQLVAALHPDRHEAFVLTQVLDLSYAEAAEVCGCPVGTIRSRVARAREDLVRALGDTPADGGRRQAR
ncbi:sigma-70 family RNA polymerase sigma factor [Pseudonocardia zijingensis]|jgi:RNA polymerase sigma-70 factor (ECF subfamily)|uniref:Sigma-70 family RNA polymerase sigma factor n=1 Tax=Pseudonocardia zijingensis TaxID=153376 RepID=A0ABN1PPR2_9PSEU